MWEEFHFLNPMWFLALIPLSLLLWRAVRARRTGDAWRRVVDPRLFAVLAVGSDREVRKYWPLALLGTAWIIAVTALANPTFEREPIPAFRGDAARVVALDLSSSMLAGDLTPTRIDRARYKVADILARSEAGQSGLIVFAGDAFPVSPLTDDADTIIGMLDALSPEIMPLQGSRPDLAIARARELLEQAGAHRGEVVLLTDDAGDRRAIVAAQDLRAAGHQLDVIGVGTAEGAVVPGVRSSQGEVIAKLDSAALGDLARAGGGAYSPLTSGASDLDRVLRDPSAAARAVQGRDAVLAESWKELGPWLVLALLPFGALAFRRGWLLGSAMIAAGLTLSMPQSVMAFGWNDLWQRKDQQVARALSAGDFARTADLATDPAAAGAAHYRLGEYETAAEVYAGGNDAEHHYNRGNALARSGRLRDAIAAYGEALSREPGMADAQHNKAQVERLLNQQRQQEPEASNGQASEQRESSDQARSEQASDQRQSGQTRADQARSGSQPVESNEGGDRDADAGEDPPEQSAEDRSAQGESRPDPANDGEPSGRESVPGRDEQAAADYRAETDAETGSAGDRHPESDPGQDLDHQPSEGSVTAAETPTPEEQESRQATDQWLRRIPDDPAALLRRKFLYQHRARAARQGVITAGNPW